MIGLVISGRFDGAAKESAKCVTRLRFKNKVWSLFHPTKFLFTFDGGEVLVDKLEFEYIKRRLSNDH